MTTALMTKALLILFLLFPYTSFADSAVIKVDTQRGPDRKFELSWSTTDGTVTDYNLPSFCGFVVLGVIDPGTTAPTANYDIAFNDEYGMDIFGGAMENRSATDEEQAVPLIGGAYGSRYVCGQLTLSITNNSAAANGKVVIYVKNN